MDWTTATTLLISTLSLGVAGTALGWNIYRDVLMKPRVKADVCVGSVIGGVGPRVEHVVVSATNHGPGRVRLEMINLQWGRFFNRPPGNRSRFAVVFYDHTNPLSGELPAVLEPGDSLSLLLPYTEECFLAEAPARVGIRDSYGRGHWAPQKRVRSACKAWRRRFEGAP